ncbi:imm11 family protein [Sphingomonas astaxanthinifaciens]|uniref:Immunity MXAN-0049 protein domain-containing protein n=1 Tax=Sphingomonas astaxanthinifaciens DSM 22298 TaxID=1123267 RepID=A0ABQ5Z8B9_9SPHN|nr:DUF1629 domain-containing protein [Sphingomonas astaxanthinifaciens]GLR47802.1 hypothetical protein GCM10007925_15150 [Sphingomonas astaxanthinifaciens DSM 22298]
MVWGMSLPSTFGEFWPDGEFEGPDTGSLPPWWERLRLHYLAQSPDEQRRLYDPGDQHVGYGAGNYPSFVTAKFRQEQGTRTEPEGPPIGAIQTHEPPQSFVTVKSYETLGSIIALNFGLIAVETSLKTIIERFEPGRHLFFPIEIRMPRGRALPVNYHVLVVGRFLHAFVPEESKSGSWSGFGPAYPDTYAFIDKAAGIQGLAMSEAKFGDVHLWRERNSTQILFCLSDDLRGAIVDAGLRLPRHFKMKQVP